MSTVDASFARLAALTGLGRDFWERLIAAPPDVQALEVENLRDQDWSDPATPAGEEVVAVLLGVATIAGAVGGIAGGVLGVKSLVDALRGK